MTEKIKNWYCIICDTDHVYNTYCPATGNSSYDYDKDRDNPLVTQNMNKIPLSTVSTVGYMQAIPGSFKPIGTKIQTTDGLGNTKEEYVSYYIPNDLNSNGSYIGPEIISVGDPDPDPDPGKVTFKSGASRSKMMSWYSFIPRYFLQRIAKVFEYGAKKYGLRNWQKGDQDFIDEIPDHIIEHVYRYVEEAYTDDDSIKKGEDHLANIGCNLVMLMHFQKLGKFPKRTQG